MQAVILAGGLATRMRPITEKIPKALIEVNGVPFVDYQLHSLVEQGITDIVFCIGYKGEMIKEHVGNGKEWGASVRYVDEGAELKGTAGALKLASQAGVLGERFFVLYGDSYLPIDFVSVWLSAIETNALATMTVLKNRGQWEKGNVEFQSEREIFYDKFQKTIKHPMTYVDYGLSVLQKLVVDEMIAPLVPGVKSDLADLFYELSEKKLLRGFEVTERFYEIGSVEGLRDFEEYAIQNLKRDSNS